MKRNPQTAYRAAIRLAFSELALERPINWEAHLRSAENSVAFIASNKSVSHVQIDANLCQLAEITAWAAATATTAVTQALGGTARELRVTTTEISSLTDHAYKTLTRLVEPMILARLCGKVPLRAFKETQMTGMCGLMRDTISKLREILATLPAPPSTAS